MGPAAVQSVLVYFCASPSARRRAWVTIAQANGHGDWAAPQGRRWATGGLTRVQSWSAAALLARGTFLFPPTEGPCASKHGLVLLWQPFPGQEKLAKRGRGTAETLVPLSERRQKVGRSEHMEPPG
ncbi:hypothetical protein KIL84_000020 [Mauremys mutica]|uniref:Uncharacterized protein n=1 Tax=Mauremys mutica TaxID=74926 RepID=A0A9D3XBL4_9SAUR|nr:hypothetical protein KIL84_000020 [Mauremys mutica]